jgi:hypothetical protein
MFVEENALRALTLPGNAGTLALSFVCPDKLQKRCRFIIELSIKPADSGKAALGQRKLALCDSALHSTPHPARPVPVAHEAERLGLGSW